MARAAGSNTKFASVNLNKSYGKPAAGGAGGGAGGGASSGSGSGNGRLSRTGSGSGSGSSSSLASSGGGMLLLSRQGAVLPAASKGGKVIVPRPVNLPSMRREHAGNDPSIALVGGSGAAGWTKAPPAAVVEEAPVAAATAVSTTSESGTTGMARLAPALSAGSTWGTTQTLSGQNSAGSLSGEHWPVPTQAGASVSNQVAVGRPGVYTPPRVRAMQTPTVTTGHVVAVEKAVVLRGEDFPTLQAALPPTPVSAHQKQREQTLKQREKQQELKDQQQKLQLLSEQHAVLKPDEVLQSQLGGPQLQPAQPSSSQTKNEQIQKEAAEESLRLEQPRLADSGLSGRSSSKAGNYSLGPASSGQYQRRQSNWTDDERDSTFRPQGGSYVEWTDRSDRESDQPANRVGENFGYGRSLPSREIPFIPGRDGHSGKVAEGRESRFSGDSSFGRESSTTAYGADNSFSRVSNAVREGGFREWGVGVNRESNFGGRGFSREGSRDGGPNKNGGDGRPNSRGRDGFDDRHGFGNRDVGPHRDANSGREGGLNRDNFFGRDNRRIQSGDFDAGRGRLGGDSFLRSGASGDFFTGRGFSGQELPAGRDRRLHDGYHFNVSHGRSSEEIHGLDNFRPSQGVGIDPPMIPILGFRRKKEEAKENDFRDEEREAFEAELERVQKAQELDRQRKQEEKEHAVERAQKELEDRERQAREVEERQAKEEEAAKEAAARAEREALEAAQKVEDERKAREDEKRQLQLEEERRKENARRKLLELEERIAKREAENKQQEDARHNVEEKPVNMWQRGEEEELSRREDVEREEEERIVASITGNAHDDDDRAPLKPSAALSYSQVSQRALQPEIASTVKSSDVQNPSADLTARVPEFRGSNIAAESERGTLAQWRREQPADRIIGSATQMYPPHGRHENIDFQASISRDRVYNGRGYGDRGDGFHGGPPNIAGFSSEGAPGEFSRRSHFNDQRWAAEDSGYFNKQTNLNRTSVPDYEGGTLEGLEDRDDRRWGRDRMDRWRSGREGPGQRPSPPQTPPYFHGSETAESSSYGRLRHSLSRQPRVPPPPGRTGPVRPPPRLSSEQTFMSNSQVRGEQGVSIQQEIVVDRTSSFSSQDDNDELLSKDSRVKGTGADVQQEDASQQHDKAWGSMQRGWQQFPTSSLTPPRSFAQVSQGLSHEDLKVDHFTPALASSTTMQNGDSPSSCLSQSEDDYEQKVSVISEVVSEIDKPELHVQSDDKSVDRDDDLSPTYVDEDEDGDDEGEEEDYETYEGYDEEEDDDKEDGLDEVDDQDEGIPDQGIDRAEVALEGGNDQGYSSADLNERVIEVVGAMVEDGDILQVQAAELAHSGQLQMTEEVRTRLLPQEESEQTILRLSVTGSTKESDACDAPPAASRQLQPPLSFMASSMLQANDSTKSSPQLASVWVPDLHYPSEIPMTLQFGLLPGTSLLQGSVPAIQIGSIQTPLHVPPHGGLQQVSHSATITPSIQFGQLAHPPSLLQSTPVLSQSTLAASLSTQMQAQNAESDSSTKVFSHEQQDVTLINAPVEGQPGKDSISLQPQSPWMNQFVSLDEKVSVVLETKETRFTAGSPSLRPERRVRDRGVAREGPSSISGSETYSRAKNSRRDSGNQRSPQEPAIPQGSATSSNFVDPVGGSEKNGGRGRGNRPGSVPGRGGRHTPQSAYDNTGTTAPYASADSAALRPRSSRRNNFRRTDLKYRDSTEQYFDASGVKSSKQTVNASTEILDTSVTGIDSRDGSRDIDSQLQERSFSGDVSRKFRAMSEGGVSSQSFSRSERTSGNDASKKNGVKFPGTADSSVESLIGKHSSEATLEASTQPGAEREDEDDFIEVRSKRQMLSDRRAEREREIKAKSNLKAKEQAGRKQRGSAKIGLQMEGPAGQGSKASGFVEKRASTANLDNVGNTTRVPQSGNTSTVTIASVPTVSGISQGIPLAPIGTPSSGSSDIRANTSKSSRSSSACGGSLVESEVVAAALTSDSPSLHQEGISGTPIAWGGTHSTRQVVSLTQIQLEEAMKPARYEASVSQQSPLEVRGSMVLDPGTTVASLAGKDKLSTSATGPIGSLLGGDKIQFGAVTSPPIGVSNSHPHTSALNVVGSPLGSHVDGVSDKNDLKKPNHLSSSELDISSFSTKGKRSRGQEDIGGTAEGGIDAEAEAEAAASAVAVAAISSDESVCSAREPMSIRITNMKNSFGSVTSTTNHSGIKSSSLGLGLGNSVVQNSMLVEDSMAAALPADLSVEPTSISIRGSPGQASSVLSTSGQSSFSGLEMSQMLGYPFGSGKDVGALQGSNDQGVPSAGPSASGWQPQHSGADSFYGGPPPSGYAGQYINHGAGMPPHMLVYSNPFSPVGQFGQLGFMSPTYLPSGKQPDWKHTPVWPSGPGVAGMSSNDGLGGMTGTQRGSGNMQRVAPGPSVVPVVQSPGPFDLNLSAPFQIPNVDSSSGWSHVPGPLHVSMSMGYLPQGRRGPSHPMDKDGGFSLGLGPGPGQPVNNGNFTSMDAAAQFPDELGLGDTSSSVASMTSPYGASQNLGRNAIGNQAATISPSAQSNNKLRGNRRSSRVTRGGNLMSSGNGNNNSGSVNLGMSVNSGGYNNSGANGSRVPPNHLQPQAPHHLYQAMGGMGQPHAHHSINHSQDQRGSSQQNSPRVGSASNWSGSQGGFRKGGGNQGRPPIGERGSSGEKIFAPPSKLKQVYVAKPSSSPRRSSSETAIFNGTEGGQTAVGL